MFPPFQRITLLNGLYAKLAEAVGFITELPPSVALTAEQRTRATELYAGLKACPPRSSEAKAHLEIVRGQLLKELFPEEGYLCLPDDRSRESAYDHFNKALRLLERARGPKRTDDPDPRDSENKQYCVLEAQRLWVLLQIADMKESYFWESPKHRENVAWQLEEDFLEILRALRSKMCVEALYVYHGTREHDLQETEHELIGRLVAIQMEAGLHVRALMSLQYLRGYNEKTLEQFRTCLAKLQEKGDAIDTEIRARKP